MATNVINIKHGGVWIFSIFIFFFNTFLLPEGFTYTLLLTPVWIYFLYLQGKLNIALLFLAPFTIYAIIHLALGVYISYYFISVTVMVALIFFLIAGAIFLANPETNLDLIFRDLAILNFIFTAISIPLLFFPPLKHLVWYTVPISPNINFPRLKLFTEEASHYSFLLAPVAIYFYSRIIFFKTTNPVLTVCIITLPLILSFSFGVLSCLLLSGLLIGIVYFKRVFSTVKRRFLVLVLAGLFVISLIVIYKLFPDNPLFVRIHNIFNGDDTSARGRTYESFILANKIIAQKSFLWGIGPGQLKLIGRDIIVQYYYYSKIPKVIRIPNACAETIIYFGYIGFALRILIELTLFVTTRVYKNPYRLWLFLFVFIYQFTGSYITNVAEYIVWLLVFSPVFAAYISPQINYSPKTGNA